MLPLPLPLMLVLLLVLTVAQRRAWRWRFLLLVVLLTWVPDTRGVVVGWDGGVYSRFFLRLDTEKAGLQRRWIERVWGKGLSLSLFVDITERRDREVWEMNEVGACHTCMTRQHRINPSRTVKKLCKHNPVFEEKCRKVEQQTLKNPGTTTTVRNRLVTSPRVK